MSKILTDVALQNLKGKEIFWYTINDPLYYNLQLIVDYNTNSSNPIIAKPNSYKPNLEDLSNAYLIQGTNHFGFDLNNSSDIIYYIERDINDSLYKFVEAIAFTRVLER